MKLQIKSEYPSLSKVIRLLILSLSLRRYREDLKKATGASAEEEDQAESLKQ